MRNSVDRLRFPRHLGWILVSLFLMTGLAAPVFAHCDALEGPVVTAARTALEREDLTPVLKWVLPEHEAEVREAFTRTLAARRQGVEARELADRWFFETLVRLHRQGEGFPYTGLQPAGAPVEPVVRAADAALESGSGQELAAHLSAAVAQSVRTRFQAAMEAKEHADESIEAGRRFVAAYVELTHYVVALDALAAGHSGEAVPGHGHE